MACVYLIDKLLYRESLLYPLRATQLYSPSARCNVHNQWILKTQVNEIHHPWPLYLYLLYGNSSGWAVVTLRPIWPEIVLRDPGWRGGGADGGMGGAREKEPFSIGEGPVLKG